MSKKKTKGNMLKKRQAKALKRKKAKQSTPVKKNRQKTQSMGRIKSALKFIPKLLFEPEIMDIKPSKTPAEVLAHSDKELERLEFFYDDQLHADMKTAMADMPVRLAKAGDKTGSMNARAVLYYLNESKSPACLNHIVIGKYYLHITPVGEEPPLTKDNVVEFIQEFEKKYEAEITAMHVAGLSGTNAGDYEDSEEEMQADDLAADSVSDAGYEDEIIAEFSEYLEGKVEDENVELYAENAEVFFNDYIKEEKSLSSYDQIKPRHVSMFFEFFFNENMNPTEEDKNMMGASLFSFAEFLEEKGIFNDQDVAGLKDLLAPKS